MARVGTVLYRIGNVIALLLFILCALTAWEQSVHPAYLGFAAPLFFGGLAFGAWFLGWLCLIILAGGFGGLAFGVFLLGWLCLIFLAGR